MNRRIQAGWITLILLMASLALTACVRPYPGSEAAAAQPTINPLATQPVLQPPVPVVTLDAGQVTAEAPVDVTNPTPVPLQPTAEPASDFTYIVVAGDTLFKIALENNVTVDEIAAANGIIDVNTLEVGQELLIPAPGSAITAGAGDSDQELLEESGTEAGSEAESETDTTTETEPTPEVDPVKPTAPGGVHVIQPGDNLFRIGLQYGCSVEQLARHNGITTPNRVPVGLEIQIPDCS